jgi:hypothetical protein
MVSMHDAYLLQTPVQLGQVSRMTNRLTGYAVSCTVLFLWACHRTPYSVQEDTARRFALALQAGDTVKMRQLSLPIAGSRMATAFAEVPREFTDFGSNPLVVRRGNPKSPDFFIASRKLSACHGGVLIVVSPGTTTTPRVATLRPVGCT